MCVEDSIDGVFIASHCFFHFSSELHISCSAFDLCIRSASRALNFFFLSCVHLCAYLGVACTTRFLKNIYYIRPYIVLSQADGLLYDTVRQLKQMIALCSGQNKKVPKRRSSLLFSSLGILSCLTYHHSLLLFFLPLFFPQYL